MTGPEGRRSARNRPARGRGQDRTQQDRADFDRVRAELRTRWPESRLEPSLDRIRMLVDLLGDPQRSFPVIHVAGTNGKTTTTRIIDAVLRGFGLRVGRFTSPDLVSVTERISVDGEPISERRFVDTYDDIRPYLDLVDKEQPVALSYFEVLTAMGFAAFADAPVDVAVIEVGMGGSWDSTNVADGRIAVVTPIGLDHTKYLGDTVGQIAVEKAGIIKPESIAVLAAQENEAAEVLIRRSIEVGATVAREGAEFGVVDRSIAVGGQVLTIQGLAGRYEQLFLPLHGAHQAQNAAVALAAVEAFLGVNAETGIMDVEVVREAFLGVSSPGRLEIVRGAPTVIVDSAHNPHGMAATVEALAESFSFRRLVGVMAVLADKDVTGMLALLEPVLDEIVVTENSSGRVLNADDLGAAAVEIFGPDRVVVEPRLDDAIETAIRLAEESDDEQVSGSGVLVTGSVVTAGEARTLLGAGRRPG
ncbi:MAG TPA: folylpolyglutamate synthase/dihydrofolate synthase family protein [Mycobacteriales bacterium]|jgi:dihydrofolate synthase/folylpolyglutamate synthase|nr:folylpolyglutamate synthase/dihydrofolate synthase family protein [Mycobacteriales bacterium]